MCLEYRYKFLFLNNFAYSNFQAFLALQLSHVHSSGKAIDWHLPSTTTRFRNVIHFLQIHSNVSGIQMVMNLIETNTWKCWFFLVMPFSLSRCERIFLMVYIWCEWVLLQQVPDSWRDIDNRHKARVEEGDKDHFSSERKSGAWHHSSRSYICSGWETTCYIPERWEWSSGEPWNNAPGITHR